MIRKLHIFLPGLMLLLVNFNESKGQALQKIQAEKIAFFTEKMNITPSEATVFWPMYNEYQEKKHEINKRKNSVLTYYKTNQENLNEPEIKRLTDRYVSYQQEEAKLLETYTSRFKEILPIEKVLQIYITEAEFRKYLIEQIRKKRVKPGLRENR